MKALASRLQAARRVASKGARLMSDRVREARAGRGFLPHADDAFVAAVHFAGDEASVYQLEQWLWSFEHLSERLRSATGIPEPFGILARSVRNAEHIAQRTALPIRFSRLTSGLDSFMSAPRLRLVFYVNQAPLNFQALRYPRPVHVHLSHGESEKISMISNQLKAYDRIFTAGRAAHERLTSALVEFSEERLMDVGRPQLDAPREVPAEFASFAGERNAQSEAAPTVFFAPTWEGDSPEMAYGTLSHQGEQLVAALLAAGMRVLYRPHPRTGRRDPAFARAHGRIRDMVSAAPGSAIDTSQKVNWQFDAADACVADMSSVAFDWLSTGKPLVMLRPADVRAEILPGGLFDLLPSVDVAEPAVGTKVVDILTRELAGAGKESRKRVSCHYLGDTSPGAQQGRFEDRTLELITLRERQLAGAQPDRLNAST